MLGFIRRCWALTRRRLVVFALAALNSPSLAHSLTLVALDSPSLTPLSGVWFNPLHSWMRFRSFQHDEGGGTQWDGRGKMTRRKTGHDFRRGLFFVMHRWVSYFMAPEPVFPTLTLSPPLDTLGPRST